MVGRVWLCLCCGGAFAVFTLAATGCGNITGSACPSLDEAERERLQRYVQDKYELPSPPELTEVSTDNSGCYRTLRFSAENHRPPFRMELHLSPDLRFLSPELFDSSVNPAEEERRKHDALMEELAGGAYPSSGEENAPVTLTLFSDFQCRYCAEMSRTLTEDILPAENGEVRLVFRHFPLPMHGWAMLAAEATACAAMQGDEHFWNLHDFVFENQTEFTAANLTRKLRDKAATLAGFDEDAFGQCLAEGSAKPGVEADVSFGKWNGVTGTPALFVDTTLLPPGAPVEQIQTMIRELTGQAAASACH